MDVWYKHKLLFVCFTELFLKLITRTLYFLSTYARIILLHHDLFFAGYKCYLRVAQVKWHNRSQLQVLKNARQMEWGFVIPGSRGVGVSMFVCVWGVGVSKKMLPLEGGIKIISIRTRLEFTFFHVHYK